MPTARIPLLIIALAALFLGSVASADPFPPDWNGGAGTAIHHQPVNWPANDGDGLLDLGDWQPYRFTGDDSQDQSVQDPSNGGTAPQNYVNVSSGCTDLTIPSTFLYFDSVNEVLMFRWRVEQIPFTYAVGPSAGPASNVDPWKSALWTVLMDTDADGYREFAVHLDGQSGLPAEQIDRLFFIYSDTDNNSIDYVNDSNICLLGHNPTAFIDGPAGSGNILNFQSALNPTPVWGNGAGEVLFDYGTTRGRVLNQDPDGDGTIDCTEYFVDYQIPLAALDATASSCNGPAIDLNTPLCLAFATSNSLQNPFQKDIVFEGELCADGSDQIATGDCFTLAGGIVNYIDQPIVNSVTASGCNPATLTAVISDAVGSDGCGLALNSSIASADFYYYQDDNSNGLADDGNTWTFAVAGTEDAVGEWSASWDSTLLPTGLFLIGVRAVDDQGNVTWSYLTEAEVIAQEGAIDPNFANPTPTPGVLFDPFINSCGTAPSVVKTASASEVPAGGTVDFTITVNASLAAALTVTQIDDPLPSGWSYDSDQGGTLSPSTSPTNGDTGTVSWTFAPGVVIPAATSGTLIFRATAPAAQGSYTNTASAVTNEGTLLSDPVEIAVGAPRLTIAKDADVLSTTPGGTIVYTITYSNDSPVATHNTMITDEVPLGLTFDSATDGGTYDSGTRVITWSVGTLFPGDGPFTVSFTATVDDPLPSGATVPILNTATIDSDETSPASNDATVFVNLPLQIQKSANVDVLAPGANVIFTIDYANTGNTVAVAAAITDPLPTGYTFVSATAGGIHDGGTPGTVNWALGNLAPGATGSVTFTAMATNPFTGVAVSTNTATLSATGLPSVSDSYDVGVSGLCVDTTYYMKDVTGDVGSAGTQNLANTTFPTATSPSELPVGGLLLDNDAGTATPQIGEMSRFYSDPDVGPGGIIVGDVSATVFIDKDQGTKTDFSLELYDYDPVGGTETLLGTQTISTQGGSGGTFQLDFSFAVGGTSVAEGRRLLWVLIGNNTSTGGFKDVLVSHFFDATSDGGDPAISTWESQSTICLSANESTLNKQVDNLSVLPGGALVYTVEFGNPGAGTLTGATLVDVLPDGVTYVSSTLNGVAAAPSISGQQLTFTVNGAAPVDPAGTITTGNSGTLVINVNVNNPLGADATVLLNDATLTTVEAPDKSDQASTVVQRPNLVIAKAVDDTLLIPGDTATYTLTVTNAGNVNATGVTVSDDFPDQTYFTFGGCVVNATNAPTTTATACGEAPAGQLTGTADVLAIGETLIYTFSMDVATVPLPPAGLTSLDNFATVTSVTDATVSTSETVTVTISTNPNLQITKTSAPAAGPLAAGDTVIYTLTISNTGSSDADDVLVFDPIPTNTGYDTGTITYEAVAQTDPVDGDTGSFNAGSNRPEWAIGTLAAGASRTLTFAVTLDSSLPNGTTVIANTATVTSSNAGLKQASADLDAVAAPSFSPTKSAPASMALPLTTVNGAVAASTTVVVADVAQLSVNDYVFIGGTAAQITDITGLTLTLDVAVTAADASDVDPVIPFVIQYTNTGTATATNVVITDDLPANTVFVAADNSGTHDGGSPGTVTWTIGTVDPGDNGTLRFWARPTTTGSFLNTATLASTELADVNSNTTTTDIGVLEPSKESAQPAEAEDGAGESITNSTGTTVDYYLRVTNNSGSSATNVTVTDTMESGFTYSSTITTSLAPAAGSSRTLTTDPTLGDNPATWCCWTLASGATLTINFVADVAANVGDGTYQNQMVVSSDNVAALGFDQLATTQDDVIVSFTGPNHVVITDVGAALDQQGRVVVEWETDAESGTLGFRLLRVDAQGMVPVSEAVLPSALAPQGSRYRAVDPAAPTGTPSTYLIVEIQSDGLTPVYGPFLVDPLGLPKTTDGHILTGKMLALGKGFAAAPRAQRPRATGLSAAHAKAKPPAQAADALRIGVHESGVHRIEAATLDTALGLSAGDAAQALRTGQMRLSLDGADVPWISDGQGQAEALIFYGQASETLYSAERIYRLELARGERMGNVNAAATGDVLGQAFVAEAGFQEDAIPFLFAGPATGDEFWFWDVAASLSGFDLRTFQLETPGVAGSGDTSLHVEVQGLAGVGVENRMRVSVNGVELGETRFGAAGQSRPTFVFDASLLLDGANEVRVEALSPTGSGMTVFAIDRFDLTWPRDYDARAADVFRFGGEDHERVQVRRLGTDDLLLLDVTDETAPREVRGARIDTDPAGGYSLSLSPRETDRLYIGVARSALLSPSSIEVDRPSNLRSTSNDADWIAIAPDFLMDGAETLAAHRAALGHQTLVVDLDDVMDEFNGGQFNPFAIREFLAYAHAEWQTAPRYVLLVGEGTFDYKNNWGYDNNLIPPVIVGGPSDLFPSDLILGDLVGNDGVPEVAIGRVPVLTAGELDAWVAKIVAYETAGDESWMNDLLFVADDPDSTGNYPDESDRLVAQVPAAFDAYQSTLSRQSIAQVRADLLTALGSGTGLVSVIGHASLTGIFHERVLTSADVPALANGERQAVVSAMSCYLGNFAYPSFDSLAEALVLHPNGGAAAVLSPSGLSYNTQRRILGEAFQTAVTQQGQAILGDALLYALAASHVSRETLLSEVLLGDPALRMRLLDGQ